MPASSRARVFTQAPWWSRLGRNTGRSRTTASRSATTEDPGEVGVTVGVRLDRGEVLLARRGLGEVAPGALEATLDGVHVGIDEAGADQPPRHVDDARTGRYVELTDCRDVSVLDEYRRGAEVMMAVEDGAVHVRSG